ncbi:MAG: Flp family type IVb pilin [Pseudomonadota bacterium]
MQNFARFLKDESGATAIEYALIAALIGVAIVTGAQALGTGINNSFSGTANKIANPGG